MTKNILNKKLFALCLPLLFVILYVFLCSLNLTSSIWFDESYSAYLIRGNFREIWSLTAVDVHPPFFYFCLKIWSTFFGTTDVALRSMSIFFGVISIILVFCLFKHWFGAKTATIASFFVSVSSFLVRYGQEMRMYTLVFSIILGATFLLTLALEHNKKRYWLCYGLLVALGMWTHYFTALAWLSHVFYLHFFAKRKVFAKPVLPTYLFAALCFAPWLPSFLRQVTTVQSGFWIPPVSVSTPLEYLSQITLFSDSIDITGWLALLFIGFFAAFLYYAVRLSRRISPNMRKHLTLLLTIICLPPLLLIIFSMPPLKSMFVDRYVTYSACLFWGFIGVIVSLITTNCLNHPSPKQGNNHPWLPILFILMALIVPVIGVINVENREPSGYIKDIITSIQEHSTNNIPIVAGTDWTYYDAVFYSTTDFPVYFIEGWSNYQYGSLEPLRVYHYNIVDDIHELANQYNDFWYITDNPDTTSTAHLPSDVVIVDTISNEHHLAIRYKYN